MALTNAIAQFVSQNFLALFAALLLLYISIKLIAKGVDLPGYHGALVVCLGVPFFIAALYCGAYAFPNSAFVAYWTSIERK